MTEINPRTMVRIDGTPERSSLLLAKANSTSSESLARRWREAYEDNEALRSHGAE